MKNKFKTALTAMVAGAMAFGTVALTGCNDKGKSQIETIYDLYVASASANGETPFTYDEWLQSIIGPKGDKGDTGAQGPKGDTGAQGEKGDTGAQGPKGDTGAQGEKGDKGDKGDAGRSVTNVEVEIEFDEQGRKVIVLKIYYSDSAEPQIIRTTVPEVATGISFVYDKFYGMPYFMQVTEEELPRVKTYIQVYYEKGEPARVEVTDDMFDVRDGYVKPDFTTAGVYDTLIRYGNIETNVKMTVLTIDDFKLQLKEMLSGFAEGTGITSGAIKTQYDELIAEIDDIHNYGSLLDFDESVTEFAEMLTDFYEAIGNLANNANCKWLIACAKYPSESANAEEFTTLVNVITTAVDFDDLALKDQAVNAFFAKIEQNHQGEEIDLDKYRQNVATIMGNMWNPCFESWQNSLPYDMLENYKNAYDAIIIDIGNAVDAEIIDGAVTTFIGLYTEAMERFGAPSYPLRSYRHGIRGEQKPCDISVDPC